MYATLDDLLAECPEETLVQLTDDEGAGAIDTARVATALTSAATIVNGYVAAKYLTGVSPAPPLLIELQRDITLFKLYVRRAAPPDRVKDAHDRAIGMLDRIAKGTLKLDEGEETLAPRPGVILTSRADRIFGRDDMAGY